MRKNQIKKESKIDKLLEIPKEISTNEPRLTNMGFNKMLNGFDLKLGEMTADEVLVTGKIESIDLERIVDE